jgi:hypothetical protein
MSVIAPVVARRARLCLHGQYRLRVPGTAGFFGRCFISYVLAKGKGLALVGATTDSQECADWQLQRAA